jgi:reactive intermediate/imine deaminase
MLCVATWRVYIPDFENLPMRKTIQSTNLPRTEPLYSQGVRIGNTIYVSGQVSVDGAGNVIGKGDMRAQARQTLENIKHVLAAEGGSLEDVVKVTMFVTDMSRADEAREVRKDYFVKNPPASTGVEVSRLAHPDYLIEIEAVAVLR